MDLAMLLDLFTGYVYYTFIRPVLKYFTTLWTGRCQLLRICLNTSSNIPFRSHAIECSLRRSHYYTLRHILDSDGPTGVDKVVTDIIALKQIKIDLYPQFTTRLKESMNQIIGYRQLVNEIEVLRQTAYNREDAGHEAMLLRLWDTLRSDTKLVARVGSQWSEIGFQGDDPATDFRGMGLLGLENLLFLSSQHPRIAQQLLQHSYHPSYGYSYSIVGINLTSVAVELVKSGRLRRHFYTAVQQGQLNINHFHLFYVYLFVAFDKMWFSEKPESIMMFNTVKDKLTASVVELLSDPNKLPLTLTHSELVGKQ